VAKVNIEESPQSPTRYGVRGIPTMMLFRGGQLASMKVGAMPKQKIVEWLNEAGLTKTAAA
jgi:thioredoxin 1